MALQIMLKHLDIPQSLLRLDDNSERVQLEVELLKTKQL